MVVTKALCRYMGSPRHARAIARSSEDTTIDLANARPRA
jgi:hypothetical protein